MNDQEKSIIHCDYKQLDKILDGFRKGDLVLLASRPTFGKTTLALNILDNIAHKGYSCVIFSLELLKEQLTQNLLCLRANVSLKKSLEGKLEVNDWEKIAVAKKQIESEKIFVDDSSNLTPEDIESKCKVLIQKEGNLDFIVIDYLQLLDDKEKVEDLKQKQSNISRKLKQIANELNVCIIVTSQLSRIIRDEKRRPELKDLNPKIIEDCDTIIFIHRPDLQDTNGVNKKDIKDKVAEIIVKKNSGNCTVGEVKMYFNNETLRFFEIKGGKING